MTTEPRNPYRPGAGRRPPLLAGRDGHLDTFRATLEGLREGGSEKSLIHHGLRGVGKTVLLLEFDRLAREAGWASTRVHEVGSQPDFRATFGRMAAQLLRSMSLRERMKGRAEKALSVVGAFTASAPGGFTVRVDVEPAKGRADSGDPEEDLAELLEEIGEVAQTGGTGALFLLDEMQNLDELSLAAICMSFHRIAQKELPVAIAGAGLPVLPERLFEAKPYASRLFEYPKLDRLGAGAARAALVKPAEMTGVAFEEAAAREIIAITEGHPYFIQEYGRVLWDEVEDPPITAEHVHRVGRLVSDQLAADFFEPYFKLATDAQQRYLMGMAELGDGPYSSGAVVRRLGYRPGGGSQERNGLIEKELIWSPRRGQIDFTISGFAEFVREVHPLG